MARAFPFADALAEVKNLAAYPAIGHHLHRRRWDAADLDVDLRGEVHVVTGGTAGIGLAIARGLARLGATVIIVGRDPARAERARAGLAAEGGRVELELSDLSRLAEVRALAERVRARHPKVHALVNNAGVALREKQVTADGVEATFSINVVSGFVLLHLLAPALARAAPARVVHVSSAAIYGQRLDAGGLLDPRGAYRGAITYANTKRAQVELSAHHAPALAELGVVMNCMHPGLTATDGTAETFPLYHRVLGPILRDPAQGADTAVWLAAAKAARGRTGELFFDRAARPAHVVPWTESPRAEAARLAHAITRLGGLPANSLELKR